MNQEQQPDQQEQQDQQGPGAIALAKPDGSVVHLDDFLGKVVLVVNVASKCGLTPQYTALEQLYRDKREAGLVILGAPAANFREQEFDSDAEIAEFCTLNYGVSFPLLSRISVAGADRHPLYGALIAAHPETLGADEFRQMMAKHQVELAAPPGVLWNFEKFLIGRDGQVIDRFAPHLGADDAALVQAIDDALAAPG